MFILVLAVFVVSIFVLAHFLYLFIAVFMRYVQDESSMWHPCDTLLPSRDGFPLYIKQLHFCIEAKLPGSSWLNKVDI